MWSWLLVSTASAGPCTLHRVAPADPHALSTARGVPRSTLVVTGANGFCEDGVMVNVLAVDPLFVVDAVASPACVSEADLGPVTGWSWVVPAPWNDDDPTAGTLTSGLVLEPLPAAVDCGAEALSFGDRTVPLADLARLRPIDAATLQAVHAVQARAIGRFGPLALTDILWTDSGRVSLPWVHWSTDEEVAATHQQEQLDTPDRQEKAVRAAGPGDAYLYFKGADPVRSDVWGTPSTILALVDTLADWAVACRALHAVRPEVCTVQLGDISWFSDKRPDPLGHRDHYAGTCVDVRLFRSDGSRYEAYWNRPDDRPGFAERGGYDAALTAAFIDHLIARPEVSRVLFNDPAATSATRARGHDDHLHVCFEPSTE